MCDRLPACHFIITCVFFHITWSMFLQTRIWIWICMFSSIQLNLTANILVLCMVIILLSLMVKTSHYLLQLSLFTFSTVLFLPLRQLWTCSSPHLTCLILVSCGNQLVIYFKIIILFNFLLFVSIKPCQKHLLLL